MLWDYAPSFTAGHPNPMTGAPYTLEQRVDVAEILPAATKTFDLAIDNPGTWMLHCHVNDHIAAGMMSKFRIAP